ncbi:Sterol desaturase [Caballeronia sordidicola]|uniref:Sterol desaturase n=2 Tax=Caballeronia sordidicola TaxID=196367 RepID=A0A242MFA4_CABSO|nr:Sterol desaturase [Caballeronia sordidicola]
MLNPVHHRIHHASNAEYLDKNYCNTFPIWDKLFGTLQQEIPGVQIKYGLNRDVRPGSFVDMYFGEIYLLAKDVRSAPTFKQKLLYVVMPPGWEPIAK